MSTRHKLYDYEVKPPAGAWDRLAASLDEDDALNLKRTADRLYDVETTPPPSAWDRIERALEAAELSSAPVHTSTPARIVRMPVRMNIFMRYAAAAILIGIIAFAIFRLSNTGADGSRTDATAVNQARAMVTGTNSASGDSQTLSKESNHLPVPVSPASTESEGTDPALASNQATGAPETRAIQSSSHVLSTARRTNRSNTDEDDVQNALYAYEDHIPESADRYVLLMTPNGDFIRMSRKLSSLICCVSGQEQDAECKDQIRKWQEEIATSPVTPAPGNVMEILDLVNSLNNGTQL